MIKQELDELRIALSRAMQNLEDKDKETFEAFSLYLNNLIYDRSEELTD